VVHGSSVRANPSEPQAKARYRFSHSVLGREAKGPHALDCFAIAYERAFHDRPPVATRAIMEIACAYAERFIRIPYKPFPSVPKDGPAMMSTPSFVSTRSPVHVIR
jgi:hypothetical protein